MAMDKWTLARIYKEELHRIGNEVGWHHLPDDMEFRASRTVKRLGDTSCTYNRWTLEILSPVRVRASVHITNEEVARETIRHEFAHAICQGKGMMDEDHGYEWKKWAVACGAAPKACYRGGMDETHKYEIKCHTDGCTALWKRHKMTERLRSIQQYSHATSCPKCSRIGTIKVHQVR